MSSEPTYPHIEVQLTGEDGNVYNIIAQVSKALKKDKEAGVDAARRFTENALASNNYNDVIQLAIETVRVL